MAVIIGKQLYLLQLVATSMIGVILATYTADNLFEELFGRTYGI
jgi:hypothetical protein